MNEISFEGFLYILSLIMSEKLSVLCLCVKVMSNWVIISFVKFYVCLLFCCNSVYNYDAILLYLVSLQQTTRKFSNQIRGQLLPQDMERTLCKSHWEISKNTGFDFYMTRNHYALLPIICQIHLVLRTFLVQYWFIVQQIKLHTFF